MDNLDLKQAVEDFDQAIVELLRASGWLYHVHRTAARDSAVPPALLAEVRSRLEAVTLREGVFDHLYDEAA
ncbi:hypothetical protein [Nocardia mexicana]|uniref:Uncharacterized protein n=1 Tax=Nocardia mexicana TaxID=279262 RepID=A0A370GMG8_9NOCA|nr:hypothetical protein [Nocardia mexicana]RDI44861.1 hypothetical protein DFR68_11513 [Nocardia mexicana]